MTVTWGSHGEGDVHVCEDETLDGVKIVRHCLYRSYGVLLWEIMTLGRSPYPGVENRELLEQIEEKGLKLSKPKSCPPEM